MGVIKNKTTAFFVILAATGLTLAASGVPSPLFALYSHLYHLNTAMTSALHAVYSFGCIPTLLLFGTLSDRIGRKPTLLVSMALLIFACVLFCLAQSFVCLLVARFLQGMCVGLITGSAMPALAELAPGGNVKRASFANAAVTTVGLALGSVTAGIIGQVTSYFFPPTIVVQTPFYFFSICFILMFFILFFSVPETVEDPRISLSNLVRIQKIYIPKRVRLPFLVAALGILVSWSCSGLFLGLSSLILKHQFHSENLVISGLSILEVQGLGGAIQTIASLRFSYLSITKVYRTGIGFLMIGISIAAIGLWLNKSVIFFGSAFMVGIGLGLELLAGTAIVQSPSPKKAMAAVMAGYFTVGYCAFSIPVFVQGFLIDFLGMAPIITAFAVMVCILGLFAIYQSHRLEKMAFFNQ